MGSCNRYTAFRPYWNIVSIRTKPCVYEKLGVDFYTIYYYKGSWMEQEGIVGARRYLRLPARAGQSVRSLSILHGLSWRFQ